jgi:hypothetical protein
VLEKLCKIPIKQLVTVSKRRNGLLLLYYVNHPRVRQVANQHAVNFFCSQTIGGVGNKRSGSNNDNAFSGRTSGSHCLYTKGRE